MGVFFENMEAEVCKQCGEVYFNPEVLKMMDEKAQTLTEFEKTISIPVVSLSEVKET